MSRSIFADMQIKYEGPESDNPLAYKWYNPDQVVMGKRLEEHLRFAVAYWHTFCARGADPFGIETIDRPWFEESDPIKAAKLKADAAFDFVKALGVPFYCFHDRDAAPEGATFSEYLKNLNTIGDYLAQKQQDTGVKLLWGTANLFSHPRFMAGAASNPNPDVFAYSAATVKSCMDLTHRLGGQNYVLWGGREGYETLLNTDMKHEMDQLGRFLNLVVEHKHKIGFKGAILIEPKPKEPSKHQYDFDTATVYGFLSAYGLEREVKVNLEANHATLAGHTFEHEIATAGALGIFGSLDMNRGDLLLGWDTDQFPNNVPELTLAMYQVILAGGLTTGGMNFDAKIRRQSVDPVDLFHAHIGGIDTSARAFLAAAKMVEDAKLSKAVSERYAGWSKPENKAMLDGKVSLEEIAARVAAENLDPKPVSGRQEYLENLVNTYF